jgi:hypothetical protein
MICLVIVCSVVVISDANPHASDAIGGGAAAVGTKDLFALVCCDPISCSIGIGAGGFARLRDGFCDRCHGERCFTTIMA